MKSFVLDTSITMAWCFADESTSATDQLLDSMVSTIAYVPSLWVLEVGNVLVGAERKGRISYSDITEFFTLLENINIRVDTENSIQNGQKIAALAKSYNLTTYDAAYLELSMRLGIPLATKDITLSKAATTVGVTVL